MFYHMFLMICMDIECILHIGWCIFLAGIKMQETKHIHIHIFSRKKNIQPTEFS